MKKSWLKTLLMIVLVCGLFFVAMEAVEACPTCSTAVGEDDKANASQVGAGYTYSIAIMMAVPYLIMLTFGIGLYRLFRNSVAAQQAAYKASQKQALAPEKELAPTT